MEYITSIKKYKEQLEEFARREKQLLLDIKNIANSGDFFGDTSYIQRKTGIQSSINSIDADRQKLIKILVDTRHKCDNIYLSSDKIDFDNCILANGISKNFSYLDMILGKV